MKKVLCIVLAFFFICMPVCSCAEEIEDEFTEQELIEEIKQVSATASKEPEVNSRAVAVIEKTTGVVLYEKNMNQKRAMASTTKIMTGLIALENADLSQIVEVSEKAAGTGGSRLGLRTGDKIKMEDLLYGLLLCSRE